MSSKGSSAAGAADSVTCLAVGDPHFMVSNIIDAGMLVKKLNKLVETVKPTFVVILGDTLHTHEKIHVMPFNMAHKLIRSLSKQVPVYLLIGNHDFCLAKGTPILMWDGQTKLSQDIQVGDTLIGDDGTPRTVKRLIKGNNAKMYTITQKNGITYTVTENHRISLKCNIRKSCVWDVKKKVWIITWLERLDDGAYELTSKPCLTQQYANKFFEEITDWEILDISVKNYLRLPKYAQKELYGYRSDGINKSCTEISVTPSKETEYFGWELDGANHRFLLADFTVTHNCNNQQFLTTNHAFNSFKSWNNVTICDKPKLRTIDDMKFVFCPYVPPERFVDALETLEDRGKRWDDATCIFAHQEFFGCRFNPVATSTEGDIWPEDFPLVVSGHIHNEQKLQSNIYYPGSSMQHAFGESADKIVALLTFKPNKKYKLQRIDLGLPKKKIVYLNVEKANEYEPEPNAYIKLVIKGRPEQFKVFRRGQGYKDLMATGIKLSFSPEGPDPVTKKESHKKDILEILYDLIEKESKYTKEAFKELKSASTF